MPRKRRNRVIFEDKVKKTYNLDAICSGCDLKKKTRISKGCDPRYPELENHLCHSCDTSHDTFPKIYKENRKKFGLGDPFGLMKGNRDFFIFSND